MIFKFDLGKNAPTDSFEKYVAWRLVNDNGEEMLPETAYILVQEFWKLMYINAIRILFAKKKGNLDKWLNRKEGKRGWCF